MDKKRMLVLILLLLLIPLTACNEEVSDADENEVSDADENEVSDSDENRDAPLEVAFSQEEAFRHIEALTAEEMEGRRAGTEGNKRATEYIEDHFSSLGLEPWGDEDSYYQWYDQESVTFTKPSSLAVLDEEGEIHKTFTNREDFVLLRKAMSREGGNSFERDFLDTEFSLESPITLVRQEDMRDDETFEEDSSIIMIESRELLQPLMSEHRDQIEGLILYPWDPISRFTQNQFPMYLMPAYLNLDLSTMDGNTPDVMYITKNTYREILSLKDQDYTLQAEGGFRHEEVSVANVIGRYESDEDTEETLLLTAHFDHVGTDSDGAINPGALDNASGTAVMMEMARMITEEDLQFPFHIEFIAFNGEEDGLLGSFHYADVMGHDPEDLKVINLDMVGSAHVDYLLLDPSDRVPEESLHSQMESVVEEADIEYRIKRNSGGSDHIPFSLLGADVLLVLDYSEEIFDNHYHNHYDTVEIIDQDRLGLLGNVLLETLESIN